jgi:hypothetical protein
MARMRLIQPESHSLPARASVVEVGKIENPQAEYERLKQLSNLPLNKLFDRYELQTRLEAATANGHQSRVLYLHAAMEQEKYERALKPEQAAIRYTALRRLSEKQRLDRTSTRKFMTERDVDDYVYSDEQLRVRYDDVADKLAEVKHAVDVLKSLADAWKERVFVLQAMANAMPKVHKDE